MIPIHKYRSWFRQKGLPGTAKAWCGIEFTPCEHKDFSYNFKKTEPTCEECLEKWAIYLLGTLP